ncbi:MAG: hypothetical protein GC178_14610 [Flavobacteriales bacterium]|nr:hypothetical protein [Flavobacteriales bacterium]
MGHSDYRDMKMRPSVIRVRWLTLTALLLSVMLASCQQMGHLFNFGTNYEVVILHPCGKYVSADGFKSGELRANRDHAQTWENFTLSELSNGQVTISSHSGRLVKLDGSTNAKLIADGVYLTEDAVFKMITTEDEHVIFQSSNDKFVRTDSEERLTATSDSMKDATKFVIVKKRKPLIKSNFRDHQLFYLGLGFLLTLISIILFHATPKDKLAVALLLLGAVSIRVFLAEVSDHLFLWDEQFHALVAKNMMSDPFHPMLFANPTLGYDPFIWTYGREWLHKQPLFLWQMALSMKLFGVHTTAMRLPSIIMSALVVLLIFRIGQIGFNRKAGYYGALLYAMSFFGLRLTTGSIHTDHNDTAFLFYVACSVWAWFEYEHASIGNKWKWALLIGLFSGAAILNKWLTGLLVFAGWGIVHLLDGQKRKSKPGYLHMLAALGVCIVVFLPWQLYILNEFPELSRFEYAYNSKHLFEVVEGHGEPFGYHFDKFQDIYKLSFGVFILLTLIFLRNTKNTPYRIFMLVSMIIVYGLFSLAVSKMIAFTYCISFLVFIILGSTIDTFFKWVVINPKMSTRPIYSVLFTTVILSMVCLWDLDLKRIEQDLTMKGKNRNDFIAQRKRSTRIFKQLNDSVPEMERTVLFNCRRGDEVPALFFTELRDAHPGYPTKAQVEELREKELLMAVLDNDSVPNYLLEQPDVQILKTDYW